jgi:hypothetical protein
MSARENLQLTRLQAEVLLHVIDTILDSEGKGILKSTARRLKYKLLKMFGGLR